MIFTDERKGYSGVNKWLDHRAVKRSVGEYVNGMAYMNGIGRFQAMLNRADKGAYHLMSGKHVTQVTGATNSAGSIQSCK